jgi:cyclic pyranopterin monophosphate synthase
MGKLTHFGKDGEARMVDVSGKAVTVRMARASARVLMRPATVKAVRGMETPKGDPLEIARIAGIMAAKGTSGLIPLCHPLDIGHVDVRATLEDFGVAIESEVRVTGRTGAEMEALTAASVAALVVYDMCKAVDRGMVIEGLRLEEKSGGRSGRWRRKP